MKLLVLWASGMLGDAVRTDVAIDCVVLVKQLAQAEDPLETIPINARPSHGLALLCALARARFLCVSTDCILSEIKGMFTEADVSDAKYL